MANNIKAYDPIFYAQEALWLLEKQLGLAGRIHRDLERETQRKGSTIEIRRPSTFSAQDAPSVAQDLDTGMVEVKLDNWREVKFKLTDKDITLSDDRIIEDHIRPAAYALAEDVDSKLALLAKQTGYFYNMDSVSNRSIGEIAKVRQVLAENKAPMDDGRLHFMVDPVTEAEFLSLPEFHRVDATGQNETLLRGTMGRRFGFEIFMNQNVKPHTAGVAADATGALMAAATKGATQISFDGVTNGGTFKAGDSFQIAGDPQRYVFTEDKTANGSGEVASIGIFPELKQDAANGAVITITLKSTPAMNLAFHRNAFCLVTAPLSTLGAEVGGARMETVADPRTNLSIRSRIYYDGDNSEVHVALDLLYGFRTLDPNLAVRVNRPT